ncbi:hypothetical protein Salat_0202600 [Sesamum alatum]|uniref:RNase H type-1 domain-containing protein n=1 Tax=Sesamum alatum TaxID=300844 RepID=A0AAE2CXW1_9LAMI|nr:hypothetical protein Salat_0202600 [Sesamum alatum]
MEWIKEGDRNTSFFHQRASTCKKWNYISKLHDKEGQWTFETMDIQRIISDYFSELFTSNRPNSDILEEVSGSIPKKVHDDTLIWHYNTMGSSPLEVYTTWHCLFPRNQWRPAQLIKNGKDGTSFGIGVINVYPICKAIGEDTSYAFLFCPVSQQVWALSDLPLRVVSDWKSDVESWFCGVSEELDGPAADSALTLYWQLWLNRNRWLWKNGGLSPPDIVWRAHCLLSEFGEYCTSLKGHERKDDIRRKWQPPPAGFVKINLDGAIFAETNSAGIGVLACDSLGACIGWRKRHVDIKASPEHIELLAAATAVDLGKDKGWDQVIIEGD